MTKRPIESPTDWWPDAKEAAKAIGCAPGSVTNACNGNSPTGGVKGVEVRYSQHASREAWERRRRAGAA